MAEDDKKRGNHKGSNEPSKDGTVWSTYFKRESHETHNTGPHDEAHRQCDCVWKSYMSFHHSSLFIFLVRQALNERMKHLRQRLHLHLPVLAEILVSNHESSASKILLFLGYLFFESVAHSKEKKFLQEAAMYKHLLRAQQIFVLLFRDRYFVCVRYL